jgi:hypothetical protein
VPWEVTARQGVLALAVAGLLAACGFGAFEVLMWCPPVSRFIMHWPEHVPAFGGVAGLFVAWMGARDSELFFELEYEDPRKKGFKELFGAHFFRWYPALGLSILRYALIGAFTGFTVLLLDPNSNLDPAFTNWLKALRPTTLETFLLLVGAAIVFLFLRHLATSLRLEVQFKELAPNDEKIRRFSIDCLRFAMVAVAVFALIAGSLYLNQIVPSQVNSLIVAAIFPFLRIVLGAAAYIFAGVFIAYFALGALFRLIRIKERRDRTHVYAREEPIPIRIFWRVSPM